MVLLVSIMPDQKFYFIEYVEEYKELQDTEIESIVDSLENASAESEEINEQEADRIMTALSRMESTQDGLGGEIKRYTIRDEEVYSLCGETGITLYGSKETLEETLPIDLLAEPLEQPEH